MAVEVAASDKHVVPAVPVNLTEAVALPLGWTWKHGPASTKSAPSWQAVMPPGIFIAGKHSLSRSYTIPSHTYGSGKMKANLENSSLEAKQFVAKKAWAACSNL